MRGRAPRIDPTNPPRVQATSWLVVTPRTLRQVRSAVPVLDARLARRDPDHAPFGAASAKERAIAHR